MFWIFKALIIKIYLFYFVYSQTMETVNHLKFTKIKCESPVPEFVTNITCKVRAVNREQSTMNISTVITKSITNVKGNVALFRRQSTGNYVPFIVNTTIDICKFLAGKLTIVYAKNILEWIQMNSNINHECPFEGYLYLNLPSLPDYIPVFVPPGDYRLNLILYSNNEIIGTGEGYGTIAMKLRRKEP